MGTATNKKQSDSFFILGPTLARGNKVLESIHSLYYLPENFQMVFTGTAPVDEQFYGEVVGLVEHDKLGDRVHFTNDAKGSHAVIAGQEHTMVGDAIMGESPEAIASAILKLARTKSPLAA